MFRNLMMLVAAFVLVGISACSAYANGQCGDNPCDLPIYYIHLYYTSNPRFVIQQINDREFQLIEYDENDRVKYMSGIGMCEPGLKPVGAGHQFIVFVRVSTFTKKTEKFFATMNDTAIMLPLSQLKEKWSPVVSYRRADIFDSEVIIQE